MKSYTVRGITDDQYKALRIKAAEKETSINKALLEAIKEYLAKK
jgi:plasmid stability protein